MVSLFKSKKTQNATPPPQVKEQPSLTSFAPRSAEPGASTPAGSIRDREKEKDWEKDGNASQTGSPPGSGWNNPSNVPSGVSPPATDQKPLREKPEPDVQVRGEQAVSAAAVSDLQRSAHTRIGPSPREKRMPADVTETT